MILPDFAQAFIEEEIQLYPIPAVVYPTRSDDAVEMHVELQVFAKGMQDCGDAGSDHYSPQLFLEDVPHYSQDFLESDLDELSIFLHEGPKLIGKSEYTMPMCAIQEMRLYPVCPFLGEPASTGWAQPAIATEMHRLPCFAFVALECSITLAWVMAEQHLLDFRELVLTKQKLILTYERRYYVVSQERYLLFA